MARSLRRAKLLSAVLMERERVLAEYRREAAADGRAAPAAATQPQPAAPAEQNVLQSDDDVVAAEPRCDAAPATPPSARSEAPRESGGGASAVPAFAMYRARRRRTVLVCVGDLALQVPFDMGAAHSLSEQ